MFEISWSEIMVVAVIALVVVGPKELPGLLRQIGRLIGQFKRIASDFHGQFNEAIKEAELDSLRKEVEDLKASAQNTFRFDEGRIPDPSPPVKVAENEELEFVQHDLQSNLEPVKPRATSRARKPKLSPEMAEGVSAHVTQIANAKTPKVVSRARKPKTAIEDGNAAILEKKVATKTKATRKAPAKVRVKAPSENGDA